MSDDILLSFERVAAVYNGAIAALHSVDLEVRAGEDRGAPRVERRGQDDAAQGGVEPPASRARRGDGRTYPLPRAGRDPDADRRSRPRRSGAGAGGAALLPLADHRGEPRGRGDRRRGGTRPRQADLERVFALFPRLAERRHVSAGLASGGEQQMTAIGRGLMSRPRLLVPRRAVDGPGAAGGARDLRGAPRTQRRGPLDPRRRAEPGGGACLCRPRHRDRERPERALRPAAELACRDDIKDYYLGGAGARGSSRSSQHDRSHLPEIDARAPVPPVPRPAGRAHVIASDAEAIEIARTLATASPRGRRSATASASGRRRSSTPSHRAGSGRSTCPKPMAGRSSPM